MIRELGWKPDFGRTIDRFAAWWAGAVLDRPPLTLTVKPTRPVQGLIPGNSPDEKPFTVDYVVDSEIARLAQFDYVGDHYPIFQPGLGPELTPTLFMDESRNGTDCAYLD
jgi:hypothetical protein